MFFSPGLCCKSSLNLVDNPRVFKFPIRKKTHHAQDAMDEMRLWSKKHGIYGDPSSTAELGGGSRRCIPVCLHHILFELRDCAVDL